MYEIIAAQCKHTNQSSDSYIERCHSLDKQLLKREKLEYEKN